MGLLAIVGYCHMYLTQIDSRYLTAMGLLSRLLLLVRCNGFVLHTCPMKNDRIGQFPAPIEHKRFIALAIGKPELAIFEAHGRTLVLNPEVPFASPGRLRIRLAQLFALPPTRKTGKE